MSRAACPPTLIEKYADGDVDVLCEALPRDILAWCNHIQNDDMTLVIVRRIQ